MAALFVTDSDLNTQALKGLMAGDSSSQEALAKNLQLELQRIARSHLGSQANQHTLSPTALVNEAWVKLIARESLEIDGRSQFFALASKIIRSILVDYERARTAQKRGGQQNRLRVTQSDVAGPARTTTALLDLEEALEGLSKMDPDLARIVELRFFGGLSNEEVAEMMQMSTRSVMRHWRTARAWLHEEMSSSD